mmetsp:Transcript_29695/g.69646  ORF Transcript_29695/g.69646 Transcript_29695/m.69646 type:complete len:492 (+) Transcript_29695:101-1576(+)
MGDPSEEMLVSEGAEDKSAPISTAASEAFISPTSSEEKERESEDREPSSARCPSSSDHAECVSLSGSPSRDGSESIDTHTSSLLEHFLENFLTQETDPFTGEQQDVITPADSMHIRGDGQIEISKHDDAGNLFALLDVNEANDGDENQGAGRASAASLCVINGEQDDISVITEAVLLELPESGSGTKTVTFDDDEELTVETISTSPSCNRGRYAMPRNASGKHAEREVSQNPICVDLCCGIDCVDTLTRLGEWTGDKWGGYEHPLPVWYQRLTNPSRRSKSSKGDEGHDLTALIDDGELARKHFADAGKQKKKESQNTNIHHKLEEEEEKEAFVVPEKSPDKSPTNVAPPEDQHFSGESLRESRGDDVEGTFNEEDTPRDDTEEREQPEKNEETTIVSLTHKPPSKAPVSILKKSSYQLNVTSSGSEIKKKAKSSATPPGRTPKSTKQYVDTSKRPFWSSKSPKAVPVPNFKRQKGWTSSNAAPSDYAMMI